jgi:hypothetical protein
VDLLAQRHRAGRRFEPLGFSEDGDRVSVRLRITDPRLPVLVTTKVFTFEGDRIVLLEDTDLVEPA